MASGVRSIALDIGGTRIKMALIQDGHVLKHTSIPSYSEGRLADRLSDIEKTLFELAQADFSPYAGLGIAMPCLVDSKRAQATEIYGKFLDAPQLDLRRWAEQTFRLPVTMEQDSKAALLGEVSYGVAKGFEDAVLIIMGTGVGTAVMIGGRLLESRNHFAGSLGSHIVIEMNGRKCSCNSAGCLEAYASGWALPGLIRSHPQFAQSSLAIEKTLSFLCLERAVREGDRVASDVLRTVTDAMRAGIISMIHAYDPAAVILCGGPLNMGELFTGPLLDGITARLWGNGNDVRFLVAGQPDQSVLLGLHYLVSEGLKEGGSRRAV